MNWKGNRRSMNPESMKERSCFYGWSSFWHFSQLLLKISSLAFFPDSVSPVRIGAEDGEVNILFVYFFSSLRLFCCKHLKHFKAIQRRLAAMGCGGDWFVSEREETTQGWRLAPICDCWLKRGAFSPVQRDLLSTKISGSGAPATEYQQTGSSDNFRGVKKNIHQNCLNFYVGLSIFFFFLCFDCVVQLSQLLSLKFVGKERLFLQIKLKKLMKQFTNHELIRMPVSNFFWSD